ncbi:hypothetical protein SCALM49S_05825 [Streptomyces californicus]
MLSGDVATALRLLRTAGGQAAGHGTVAAVDAVSAAWAERFGRALAPLREEGSAALAGRPTTAALPPSARLLDELGLARASPASLMARWASTAEGRAAPGPRAATAPPPRPEPDSPNSGRTLSAGPRVGPQRTAATRRTTTPAARRTQQQAPPTRTAPRTRPRPRATQAARRTPRSTPATPAARSLCALRAPGRGLRPHLGAPAFRTGARCGDRLRLRLRGRRRCPGAGRRHHPGVRFRRGRPATVHAGQARPRPRQAPGPPQRRSRRRGPAPADRRAPGQRSHGAAPGRRRLARLRGPARSARHPPRRRLRRRTGRARRRPAPLYDLQPSSSPTSWRPTRSGCGSSRRRSAAS